MELRVRRLLPTVGPACALSALLHLWGNPWTLERAVAFQTTPRFVAGVVVAVAAVVVLSLPTSLLAVDALAAALVGKTLVDLPVAPNHQLLLALLALSWLAGRGVTRGEPDAPAEAMVRGARATFLVAYGFAAFAKLNTAFFDPQVSCAIVLTDSLLAPVWPTGAPDVIARASMPATAIIELSVPLLLLWRKTRTAGVLLGLAFHGALALDPLRHFYDFTAAVILGLVWFAPFSHREEVDRSARGQGAVAAAVAGMATLLVVVGRSDPITLWLLALSFLTWLVWAVGRTAIGGRRSARRRGGVVPAVGGGASLAAPPTAPERPASGRLFASSILPAVLILPAFLAVANGVSPYLEVKNYGAWNMYSNLRTADGASNHLIVRRTVPVTAVLKDRVVPLDQIQSGSEWPRQAVLGDLLLSGPNASRVVVDHGREVRIFYTDARDQLGPVRFRLQRVAPISVDGPEPCRMATGL